MIFSSFTLRKPWSKMRPAHRVYYFSSYNALKLISMTIILIEFIFLNDKQFQLLSKKKKNIAMIFPRFNHSILVTFILPFSFQLRTNTLEILDNDIFLVDGLTGLLQTNQTLGRFADGYFLIFVKATNGRYDIRNGDFARLKVRTSSISLDVIVLSYMSACFRFRFMSCKTQSSWNLSLTEIPLWSKKRFQISKEIFKKHLLSPWSSISMRLNSIVNSTEVWILVGPGKFEIIHQSCFFQHAIHVFFHKIDSSCFQIIENENSLELKRAEELLDFSQNPPLKEILDRYDIVDIEVCWLKLHHGCSLCAIIWIEIVFLQRCSTLIPSDSINWIEACIIVIAILIGLLTFISAIVLCCLYSK